MNKQILKTLPKCAAKTVASWVHSLNKSQQFTLGIVTVIHTFGRDLKWNPHVHMIVSGDNKNMKALKNKLYKEKNKGFYVHAKTEINFAKTAAKYVDWC